MGVDLSRTPPSAFDDFDVLERNDARNVVPPDTTPAGVEPQRRRRLNSRSYLLRFDGTDWAWPTSKALSVDFRRTVAAQSGEHMSDGSRSASRIPTLNRLLRVPKFLESAGARSGTFRVRLPIEIVGWPSRLGNE